MHFYGCAGFKKVIRRIMIHLCQKLSFQLSVSMTKRYTPRNERSIPLPTVVKPPELVLLTLEMPYSSIVKPEMKDLPENCDKKGYFDHVQRWGTSLQSLSSLSIIVPSGTSPDYNILINPSHRTLVP